MGEHGTEQTFEQLIEASSLGTPDARRLRALTTDAEAEAVRRAAHGRFGTGLSRARPELVGRAREWAALVGAVKATAEGAGGCTVLTAPAGSGKTHLFTAVVRAAERRGLTVAYRAATEPDRTAPLRSLLAALSRLVPVAPTLAWLGEERPTPSTPDRIGRELEDLAADRPLVVIIDDAQWMDEFSVLAVRTLVLRLSFSPVRWFFARRPGAGDALDDLIGLGAQEITVGPLTDADVAELCAREVGTPVDASVLAQVERCGGNPLWITQLLAALRAEEQLAVVGGRATLVGGEVPTSFTGVTELRLSGLPDPVQLLLRAGSVLTGPFRLGEVAALLSEPEDALWTSAERAVDAGMLVPGPPDGYTFAHEMIREAVYTTVPAPMRHRLHQRAAVAVGAAGRPPAEVAEHLMKAGPAAATGQTGLLREAAARIAALAPGAAADIYLYAVSGLDAADPRRAEFTAEAVPLLASAGRLAEAQRYGEAAFRSGLDATTVARLCLGLAEACKHTGHNADAVEYTSRGLRLHGVADEVRARLCAARAHAQFYADDLADADRFGARAHGIGADPGAAAFGLAARSLVAAARGRLTEALRHASRAVELADRAGGEAVHRHPQIWLGSALTMLDRLDEAAATLSAGRRESARLGTGWSGPLWHYYEAQLLCARGDLQAAADTALAGVELAEQQAVWQLTVPLLGTIVRIHVYRGDLAAARMAAEKARERTRTGITAAPEDVIWPEALLAYAEDGAELAAAHLRPLYRSIEARPVLIAQDPVAAATLVRIATAAGRTASAQAVVRAARSLAARNPALPTLAGVAAHAEGLHRGDVALLRAAAERLRRGPRRLVLAAALDDLAAAEDRAGNGAAAASAAAEATALRRACGVTGTRHRRRDALSPVEVAVASRAARGLRNRQIADEMKLPPYAVYAHMRQIYTKLDIDRVSALTAWYAGRHPVT
ncbi:MULTISPECIES: helix-turn-helix transcriptional regulator [Catenuloplanes]|uniref:DNA-binding CsgD family transcriptional regulator n=1 Tax=Catenuloplanes niger TaxID=587534 RepID=A0AAE4CY89_9ACTN|nr:AAA family ATPase [Catenuloplanes niger]MDR7328242.1 DNA-binding CsgD family transcriptional regulator [Catenuloplanes niger]